MPEQTMTQDYDIAVISDNKAVKTVFSQILRMITGAKISFISLEEIQNSLQKLEDKKMIICDDKAYNYMPSGLSAPVLVLSHENDVEKASHILPIPISVSRLLNRIHILLHRKNNADMFTNTRHCGTYEIRPENMSFLNSQTNKETRLTQTEYHLLYALFEADHHWLSRDDLLDKIWGYSTDIQTRTLETHIYRLRQKIEEDPSNPQILINENLGYKIHTPLRNIEK